MLQVHQQFCHCIQQEEQTLQTDTSRQSYGSDSKFTKNWQPNKNCDVDPGLWQKICSALMQWLK